MPVYLLFLTFFFAAPLVVLWIFQAKVVSQYKKTFLLTTILTFLFGVTWDMLSVVTGLWRYDVGPTLGLWFGVLPLEEYLFTLIFPLFVVTVTIVVRQMFHQYVR